MRAIQAEPPEPDGRRELERWLRFARRAVHFWPTVVGALALASVACGVLLYSRQPAYRSETVLLYTQGLRSTDSVDPANPRGAATRLKELLLSRRELSRVANQFGLYAATRESHGIDYAVDEMKRQLEFRAPGGDTFSIAYKSASPREAQSVTAALAKMVIDGDATLRKTQTEFARDFLATEEASKAKELRAAEQRLAVFMGENRRFALDVTPLAAGAAIRATLPVTEPSPPAGQTFRGPRALPATSVAQKLGVSERSPATAGDAAEQKRAVASLAAAHANLNEQLARFTPVHPDVKTAQATVERAEARVEAFAPAAVAPASLQKAEIQGSARRTTRAVQPAPALPRVGTSDVVELEAAWLELTRGVTETRLRLDQLEVALSKAEMLARAQSSGNGVQIAVIEPAYLPQRPLGVSTLAIVATCLVFGLLLGALGAALRAAFDDRIFEASDLGRVTSVLVQIPRFAAR